MNKEDDTCQRLEDLEVGIRGVMIEIDKLTARHDAELAEHKDVIRSHISVLSKHDAELAALREQMEYAGKWSHAVDSDLWKLNRVVNGAPKDAQVPRDDAAHRDDWDRAVNDDIDEVMHGTESSPRDAAIAELRQQMDVLTQVDEAIINALPKHEGPPPRDDAAQGDELGRIVRDVWVDYAIETGNTKPSNLKGWDDLSEYDKEVDRRIGRAVANHVLAPEDMAAQDAEVFPGNYPLELQVDRLAMVLMDEFGGPTRSEGAIEMAMRVLREQKQGLVTAPEGKADVRRRVLSELLKEIEREHADGYTVNVRFYMNPHEDREVRLTDWLRAHLTPTADAEGVDDV